MRNRIFSMVAGVAAGLFLLAGCRAAWRADTSSSLDRERMVHPLVTAEDAEFVAVRRDGSIIENPDRELTGEPGLVGQPPRIQKAQPVVPEEQPAPPPGPASDKPPGEPISPAGPSASP